MDTTPGKMRGLQTTSNDAGVFTILALDHGMSLAQSIRPQAPETVTYEEMVAVKAAVLRRLAGRASAVLLDPVYGLGPAVLDGVLPGQVGLLLSVEDGDYAAPRRPARLLGNWSVQKIKLAGAAAVKYFFYYHPDDREMAAVQEAFVTDLAEACRSYDLPLFAEPLSYDTNAADRPGVVVETARRISRLGIDVLKVEFPVDVHQEPDESVWAAACSELSAACRTPWALLSAGVDFATFARQVKVACRAGSSGFLAGRAVWKEAMSPEDSLGREEILEKTAAPRLGMLADIASEYGRAWTEFYPFQSSPPQGWHSNIGN
jgi:tagatose 1,6-diphosphate aldolase